MIDAYTNQTAVWKRATSINEYNEPSYSTTSIKCRIETGHKLVRDKQGDEVVSTAAVFTKSAISANDLIDGNLIISVESAVKLNGSIGFYKAYIV